MPFSEDDTVDNPISPYACTKKAVEMLCYTYHHLYDIPIVCLRFFTVYGPRQRPDLAIYKFFMKILNNEAIEVYGDGTTSRDYTYIDDIINAIIKVSKKKFQYEIFNIGSDTPVCLIDLIKMIEKITSKQAQIVYKDIPPGDVKRTWADITKAKEMLDYNPKITMEEGLAIFKDYLIYHNRKEKNA